MSTTYSLHPFVQSKGTLLNSIPLLVVDDNYISLKVALKMLERMGFAPDSAVNGKQALAMHQSNPYEIILMDVHMPVMNGLDTTRTIRERWGDTPIIIALTASVFPEDKEVCLQAGMDYFLPKPIRMEELYDLIKRVLVQVLN